MVVAGSLAGVMLMSVAEPAAALVGTQGSAGGRSWIVAYENAAQASGTPLSTANALAASSQLVRPRNGWFRLVGRGWGHGRGMSQWGAYRAAQLGRSHREILRFYYPGTRLARNPDTTIRVRLTHEDWPARVLPESGLTLYWTGNDRRVRRTRLPASLGGCRVLAWRVRAVGGGDMTVQAQTCRSWRTFVSSSQIRAGGRVSFVDPDDTVRFVRRVGGGTPVRRTYRGYLRVVYRDGQLRLVNVVPYEQYLRSVVPAESPASWPLAALRAQAIAARSYAVRSASGRRDAYFDVYDTTASQVYNGLTGHDKDWDVAVRFEHPRTDTAVRSTRRQILRYQRWTVYAEFGSSNGGWTADGGRPYLRAKYDAWDWGARANPYRTWTDSVSVQRLRAWYPSLGTIRGIQVTKRSGGGRWGGRISEFVIVGSNGRRVIRGDSNVRAVLGVRSSYCAFQR